MHDTERQLREQHAVAVKERDTIVNACAPREEVLAHMEHEIDLWAAKWAQDHGFGLVLNLGPGHQVTPDGTLAPRAPKLPDSFYGNVPMLQLLGIAPAVVKARLAQIIKATPYDEGPPAADRARFYAAADARVAELERQHTDLVDAAAALDPPIALTLLPVVAERRTAEAEKRKRNATADEDRRRREAAVNPRHENAGRQSSVSTYIAKGRL